MKSSTDFLKSDKVIDGHAVSGHVHRDLCDVYSPSVGGIGFAPIFLVIPENAGRRFIVRQRLEFSVFGDVFRTCSEKLVSRISISQKVRTNQRLLKSARCRLQKLSDHHYG